MGPLVRRHALAILISLLLAFGVGWPASAINLPGLPWGDQNPSAARAGRAKAIPAAAPSGRLQEVAAPGGVQQLRSRLAGHHPRLTLKSPEDGDVLTNQEGWTLQIEIEDWPLASDPELGIGPHVAVQIDDAPPLRFTAATAGPGAGATLKASLPPLSPGSHRLSAYAAYPWGEAIKGPGASLHWRLHQFQSLKGTQPEEQEPWLVMVSPAELSGEEPLMLDWLVWNAPLQNLRDGDGRWRLRLTLNGDSFLVDSQEALWLRQSNTGGSTSLVQMELLDGLGEPITPNFNNQLRAVPARSQRRPVWLRSKLTDQELARLLGESEPEIAPEPNSQAADSKAGLGARNDEPNAAPLPPKEAEDEPTVGKASQAPDQVTAPSSQRDRATTEPETAQGEAAPKVQPEPAPTSTTPPTRPATKSAAQPSLKPAPNEERLAPTTSLGGSARELLNADGTQR